MTNATRYGDYFPTGLEIGGVPLTMTNPGKIFYVHKQDTVYPHSSDGNKGTTRDKPLATIDAGINKCTADRGDAVIVLAGHTEDITSATDLVMDKAGVAIVGLGAGDNRPVLTFTTAAAAAIPVTAANCTIANLVLKCDITVQNHMLDVKADDLTIVGCELREGSATGLGMINADTADGDSDRLTIVGCKMHAPTAGNYDHAIFLGKDHTGVTIRDCDIFGDFDIAGIAVPTAGNAQVNLRIIDCRVDNLLTAQMAIEIIGTASTGQLVDCRLEGDTLASIVDTGGLSMYECYVHDKADQSHAIVTGTVVS